MKEYAEQGYIYAVQVDLSKYFDTLNHELLMNLLRKQINDKRVIRPYQEVSEKRRHGKRRCL